MNDLWTNRLSEYLDDELDSAERAALEAHLKTCGACYATLSELRQVVARAQSLADSPPRADLWPNIRPQLTQGSEPRRHAPGYRARRFSFTAPQLLAASIALVLLSSGGAWLALHSRSQPANTPVAETTSPSAPSQYRPARWKVQSDMAIAELQDALSANEAKLDTATVRVVRENLVIIDHAIAQAQKALRNDPGNTYLNLHLANTMRQKIELLRRANALASQS
jgi:anti-sigma factor RsiW